MHLLGISFFPFFGFGFVIYFLPSLVAAIRNKRDTLTIFLLNFFLGWSVIGWGRAGLGAQDGSGTVRAELGQDLAALLAQQITPTTLSS